MAYAGTLGHRRRHGSGLPGRLVGIMVGVAVAGLAGAPIAYMLWPTPKAISLDAPSLPITIGGMAFNVPPAAIRFKVQRRPGAQARVDRSFVWPWLTPPDLSIKPLPSDAPDISDRLFVTIAASDNTLAPAERLKTIYPRYADAAAIVGGQAIQLHGGRDVRAMPVTAEGLLGAAALLASPRTVGGHVSSVRRSRFASLRSSAASRSRASSVTKKARVRPTRISP